MKRDSIIDYLACIIVSLLGPVIRSLPMSFSLFLGRRLGDLLYYFDLKHKAIAYANIKTAFGERLSPFQLSNLTHEFYLNLGQSILEIFFIPLVSKQYIDKYISLEGLEFIDEAFKKGKGVIFVSMHAGSWELSNIICANLGFPFRLFVGKQRYPRLDKLLNQYRSRKGCRIIQRQNQVRHLIEALKGNEATGMTLDQGGKTGRLVKFFGRYASMATGAVRLALKYDSVLLVAFYARINGPYIKTVVEAPFKIKKSGDPERDLQDNLQRLVSIFEKYITMYPAGYFWPYKIWKYGFQKNILILSDARTGHLRQSEAVANIVSGSLAQKGNKTKVDTLEVKFKNRFSRYALLVSSCLSGRYHCQGCLWCLRAFLEPDVYTSLLSFKPDVIISCGSSVAPVNYIIAKENLAKSIVIMRPSILSTKRFDLVIMSRHDNPPQRKNVVITESALNLIDERYLKEQSEKLIKLSALSCKSSAFSIGFLIGGNTKNFSLSQDALPPVIREIKSACEKLGADVLVTTSRRTSREVEMIVKEEFKDYPGCRLLVIANEKNIPEAVGGILGLSQVVICSPESVSMISEAINSKKYVLVFKSQGLSRKHREFLGHLAENKYIYLTETSNLSKNLQDIWRDKPPVYATSDNLLVDEAIRRIV